MRIALLVALPVALPVSLLLALLLAACGPGGVDETAEAHQGRHEIAPESETEALVVTEARALLLEDSGAIYLTLHNPSAEAITVTGFRSDIADSLTLHQTTNEDGMMTMVEQEPALVVGPGETVVMAPGGLHLMVLSPRPTAEGSVTVQLDVAGGETVAVQAELSSPMAMAEEHRHDHG